MTPIERGRIALSDSRQGVQVSRSISSQTAQYFVDYIDSKVRSLVGDFAKAERMAAETR